MQQKTATLKLKFVHRDRKMNKRMKCEIEFVVYYLRNSCDGSLEQLHV
jgi:hypothetical protein